jgi:MFS family permease
MYLSTRSLAAAGRREATEAEPVAPARPGSGRNVWYLGLTSMFTDISSEMVGAILPLYLTLLLGFGPLQFGLFDGAYQGLAALAAIAAALGADRGRRHKLVAGIGYALSAVCTAGLLVGRGLWGWTISLLYLTRLGKGVRTAPRDALISLSVAPQRLGRAFGLHRAFDTVGAVAGPLVAFQLLRRNETGYDTVFAVAFFVAVIGVAVFVLFVQGVDRRRDDRGPEPEPEPAADRRRSPVAALRPGIGAALGQRRFRYVLLAGLTLALVRPGDGLLYLVFQRDGDLTSSQFALLYSGASVIFLVAAIPFGILADRIGRLRVFVAGEAAVAGALAVLAGGLRGPGAMVLVVALVGVSYAATDGVLVALASSALPERWRTTGLAVVATVIALGRFLASAGFGAAWERFGSTVAARLYLVGVLAAVLVGWVLVRRDGAGPPGDGPDDRAVMSPAHLEAA